MCGLKRPGRGPRRRSTLADRDEVIDRRRLEEAGAEAVADAIAMRPGLRGL